MSEAPANRIEDPDPPPGGGPDGLLTPPGPSATEATAQQQQQAPRLWGGHTVLSLGVAAAILITLGLMVDFRTVWQDIQACDKGLALLGLLCHYSTYQVRGVRWRRTLRHIHGKASSWKFGLLVFFYNSVDNLVPAKLGDVYGAHLAKINLGVTRSAALGSIVFVRMVDAWVVLVLATLSSSLVFADRLPNEVIWALILGGVIAAAASLIVLTFALLRKISPSRLPEPIQRRIQAFQTGMWPRPREWATIISLTAVIWALETAWILCLASAFRIELDLGGLLFLTMIPLLASAFPLTPAGAGVVELSLYGCLRAVGVAGPLAASVTVLNRLIDYWLHILLGFITWTIRGRLGLRTWREVPFPDAAGSDDSESPSDPEISRASD